MGRRFSLEAVLQFKVDGSDKAVKATRAINQEVNAAQQELQRIRRLGGLNALAVGADAIAAAEADLIVLNHELTDNVRLVNDLGKEIARLSEEGKTETQEYIDTLRRFDEATAAAARLRAEIRAMPQELREASTNAVGFLGDIDTGLQTASGLLTSAGGTFLGTVGGGQQAFAAGALQEAAKGLAIVGEFFAFFEQLPRLAGAVDQLGQTTRTYANNLRQAYETQRQASLVTQEQQSQARAAAAEAKRAADAQAAALAAEQSRTAATEAEAAASTQAAGASQTQAVADQTEAAASTTAATANQQQATSATVLATQTRAAAAGIVAAGTGVAALAVSAAAAVAPLAAIGVVLEVARRESQKTDAVIQGFLGRFPQITAEVIDANEFALESTEEQLQATLEAEKRKQDALKEQINTVEQFITQSNDAIEREVGVAGRLFGDVFGLDTDEAEKELAALKASLETTELNINNLNNAQTRGITATRSYIEALEQEREIKLQQTEILNSLTEEERALNEARLRLTQDLLMGQIEDVQAALATAQTPQEQDLLSQQLRNLQTNLNDVTTELEFYNGALARGITEQRANIQSQLEIADLAATITEEQRQTQLDALTRQRNVLQAFNDTYAAQSDEYAIALEGINETLRQAGEGLVILTPAQEAELRRQRDQYQQYIEGGAVVFDENITAITTLTEQINLYNGVLKQAAETNEAAAIAAERSAETEREAIAAEQERIKVLQDVTGKLATVREQEADAAQALVDFDRERLTNSLREARRAAEVARIETQIAEAERLEAAEAVQAELVEAEKDYGKERRDAIAESRTDIAELTENYNDSIAAINTQFFESELAAVQAYRKAEIDAERDYNRQRLKLLDDLNLSLLEAVENNDVTAFIRAQRQAETQLQALDAGATDAERERSLAFQAERAQAASERQQRLADLQTEFTAQRQARQEALRQELADLATQQRERIAQIEAGNEEELKQSQILREQLNALRQQFAEEDKRRQQQEQRQQLIDRVNQARQEGQLLLEEQRRIGQARINNEVQIGNALLGIQQQIVSNLQRGLNTRPAAAPSNVLRPRVTAVANATGGIYDSPTLALLGEAGGGRGDVVIPFNTRQSDGLALALREFGLGGQGRTSPVNITIEGMSFGENVTRSEVDRIVGDVVGSMQQQIIGVFEGIRV